MTTKHNRKVRIAQACWRHLCVSIALATCCASDAFAQGAAHRADLPDVRVGDHWKFVQTEDQSKRQEFDRTAVAVTDTQIRLMENGEPLVLSRELNTLQSTDRLGVSGNLKTLSFPLEIGKKWKYKDAFTWKPSGFSFRRQAQATVVAYEKIKVPAGEFDAFRVELRGFENIVTDDNRMATVSFKQTVWFAPASRCVVKNDFEDKYSVRVRELVEFAEGP